MSRICPKCGAKAKSGSGACPACGHVPEDDVQIYTPRANTPEAAKPSGASRRVAAGVLCAVLVAGGALALWRISREHTLEKTAAEFQAALASGDFERLRAVAAPSGSGDFTEDALSPMFALYRESAAFRQQTAQLADEGSPCLHVEKRGGFPFSTYRVLVDTCELDVSTNIAGASVTAGDAQTESVPVKSADNTDSAGYTPDASNLVRSGAKFDSLYPGLYDLDISYTSSAGQSFEKSTTVNLMQPTQLSLDLDYTSLYVWNSSSISVDLSIDGAYYTTLSAGSSLQLSPLHADSVVTASCKTDAGEVLTDSVPAANRSFEVLFSLGTVDVYNDYDSEMDVQLNGADYCVIPAKTLQTLSGISVGSTLSFSLADFDIFRPYDYSLSYDYDSICPILSLSEDAKLAVSAVLQDALSSLPLTGEDDGLLGSLDALLVENGWSRSEVLVSDVTVGDVYAMQTTDGGTLLSLSGYYTCTNITLPASADLPEPSADDEADTEQDVLPESIENPQYQSFYASVFFDGENWSIAE